MRPFERHQNARTHIRRFLLSSAAVLALFAVMVFSIKGAWGMYGRFAAAQEENALAQEHLQSLAQRKAEVASAVEGLSTQRGIEAQVRERYGVVRPGEGEIEIVHNEAAAAAPEPQESGNSLVRLIKALFIW